MRYEIFTQQQENTKRKEDRKIIEDTYISNLNTSTIIDLLRKINDDKAYVIFRVSETVENTIVATIKTIENKIIHARFIREPNGKYSTESEDRDEYEYLNPQELITQFNGDKIIVLNKIQVLELIKNENVFNESENDLGGSDCGHKNHFIKCSIV